VRLAFLLLLAANLGFFAWARFLAPPDPAVDRRPLERQLEPHKLRIVSERELAAAKPAPAKPAPKPKAAAAPPAPAPAPLLACLEWGSFGPADATLAAQRLEPLALGARLAQYRGEESASWWVHMPPQGSRAGALRKAAELKKLGIEDYFVVQDAGPLRWSISLGVFSTEDAAVSHLKALQAQGVRTAVIGRRETRVPKVWFQVREVEPPLEARLREIAQDFEGATLHECAPRG
jgi:hypothetical protein